MPVTEDLNALFCEDISGFTAGAVIDSGSLYFRHQGVETVSRYFNTGVLLLSLNSMREEGIEQALLKVKTAHPDDCLMDQNVINLVLDGRIKPLPIRYNCQLPSVLRAHFRGDLIVSQINDLYGTEYPDMDSLINDAAVIHFSSKYKPWIYENIAASEIWMRAYRASPFGGKTLDREHLNNICERKASLIVPVYNTPALYLEGCLRSLPFQTLADTEIIVVDDASDNGARDIILSFAEHDRRLIPLFLDINAGVSSARNKGLRAARGKYIIFIDSDDSLEPYALETMYVKAEELELDLLLFDGKTIFENSGLEQAFGDYVSYYIRKEIYPGVSDGPSLYTKMAANRDYKVSVNTQFIRRRLLEDKAIRFYPGIIHEDNLFSFQVIQSALRAAHIPDKLYCRLIRENSIVTSKKDHRNVEGLSVCAAEIFRLTREGYFTSKSLEDALWQSNSLLRRAKNTLAELSGSEKELFLEGSRGKALFSFLMDPETMITDEKTLRAGRNRIAEHRSQTNRLKDELAEVKNAKKASEDKLKADLDTVRGAKKTTEDKLKADLDTVRKAKKDSEDQLRADLVALQNAKKTGEDQLKADLVALQNAKKAGEDQLKADLVVLQNAKKAGEDHLKADLVVLQNAKKANEDQLRADLVALQNAKKASEDKLKADLDAVRTAKKSSEEKMRAASREAEILHTRNQGKTKSELNHVRGSMSFKIGRAITWFPRRLRDLLRPGG